MIADLLPETLRRKMPDIDTVDVFPEITVFAIYRVPNKDWLYCAIEVGELSYGVEFYGFVRTIWGNGWRYFRLTELIEVRAFRCLDFQPAPWSQVKLREQIAESDAR
ncbi:MAG: hypothetical protein ACRD2L_17140, partial [Terriglobia bacterium]